MSVLEYRLVAISIIIGPSLTQILRVPVLLGSDASTN